jgi:hypothetical protein
MSDTSEDPNPDAAPSNPGGTPHPIYNWMSGIGVALFAVAAAASLFLVLVEWVAGGGSGYAGLTLLPLFALGLVGLGLVLAGWLRERRRQRQGRHSSFFETWVVDPWAIVRGRGAWFVPVVIAVGTFALLGAGAASVGLVHYSESNEFCTQACHSVMNPEGVVYEQTAHSRIDCVACHVGAGPEGFLAAKLGGLRQMYQFVVGDVTRPIPTPIHGGTISRELCESCHAPERDVGIKARARSYFLAGEDVDPVQLAMVVKVGRGENEILPGEGVHYHMQIAEKIEYVARDARAAGHRVGAGHAYRDGGTREYQLESNPLSEEDRAALPVRSMECLDCHSRPAHRFPSAVESVNQALEVRFLPRDLPSIKEVSVQALDGGYATTAEALEGIDSTLREFYEEEYPEVLEERDGEVGASIAALRTLYQRTIFPEMKADWRAHADNSSHLEWPGCFRCHNDEMVDADGEAVSTDCSSCHAILAQNDDAIATMEDFEVGQPFMHPEDWSEMEEFTLCSDCHTGGSEVYE